MQNRILSSFRFPFVFLALVFPVISTLAAETTAYLFRPAADLELPVSLRGVPASEVSTFGVILRNGKQVSALTCGVDKRRFSLPTTAQEFEKIFHDRDGIKSACLLNLANYEAAYSARNVFFKKSEVYAFVVSYDTTNERVGSIPSSVLSGTISAIWKPSSPEILTFNEANLSIVDGQLPSVKTQYTSATLYARFPVAFRPFGVPTSLE